MITSHGMTVVLAGALRSADGREDAQGAVALAVVVGLLATAAIAVIARWSAQSRLPRGVLKRLAVPGARHHVRVDASNSMAGTWNPAKPLALNSFIREYGTGTYWLDDEGIVHLDWTPTNGRTVHLSGPAPTLRTRSKAVRAASAGYAVVLLAAFVTGYVVSSGDGTARLGVALLAAFAAAVVGWLVSISGLVGRSVRLLARRWR